MFPAGVVGTNKWNKEDIDILKTLHDSSEPVDWKIIGMQLARTPMACRKAWEHYHQEKKHWSADDDALLRELKEHRRLTFRMMVPFFEGRWLEVQIKNRWRNLSKPPREAMVLEFPTVVAEFHPLPAQNPTLTSEKSVGNTIKSVYNNTSEFCEEPWMWGFSD
jgi:hypothetical protein